MCKVELCQRDFETKTIKFFTVGCKVNQYDTQNIREQFLGAGFKELDNGPADIYVINTCTVTHHADRDSLYYIRKAKKENPKAKVIVTGCLAELDEDKIKAIDKKVKIIKNKDKSAQNTTISDFKGHTRAFLKIQDGCNNFCSYCKVPFVRGRSTSKALNIIVKEAKQLVQNGFKEIVLCGICLGSYGRDLKPAKTITDVINRLEGLRGLLRLRLSSIEPNDVSDELIDKITHSRKLCPHLHIPLQSGDDEVLKRMNRRYTASDYLRLIEKIRRKLPDIAIATDVLVGFPGETETNFRNTVKLIKKIVPLKVHIFPYSARNLVNTGSVNNGQTQRSVPTSLSDNCRDRSLCLSDTIIQQRVDFLRRISENCARQYKNRFLGRTMAVLIEDRHKGKSNLWQGWTDNYIKVLVQSGQDLKNKRIYVTLTPTTLSDFSLTRGQQ